MKNLAEQYLALDKEQREQFLHDIGAYAVSEQTWYVHPTDALPNSVTPNDGT